MTFVNKYSPDMYDVEIEHRLQEISKQIEEERTRNYQYTKNDRIITLGFDQATFMNDNAIVRQVFDLRTPDYTLVMPSLNSATPTAASSPNDKKCIKTGFGNSSWNRKFFITLILFFLVRFRGVAFESETFIASTQTDLIDAATDLFSSIYNMSHVSDYKKSQPQSINQITVNGRKDITSFAYDLGGTTCACNLEWNVEQYWQRVWYGPKYVAAHCVTALLGVFFYHRWQWVVVWKYVNEILEELSLTIYSRWAGGEKITEMESRYDTVVNDMLLSGLTFMFLGQLTVYVLRIPDPFADLKSGLEYDWPSFKDFALVTLQYYVLLLTHGVQDMFGAKKWTFYFLFGNLDCDIGYVVVWTLQIVLMCVYQRTNHWDWIKTQKLCCVLTITWLPFIFRANNDYDEQIMSLLSIVLCATAILLYDQIFNGFDRLNSLVLFTSGLCVACLFITWLQFDNILPPPNNMFYAHRKWCGISARTVKFTDSCVHIRQ